MSNPEKGSRGGRVALAIILGYCGTALGIVVSDHLIRRNQDSSMTIIWVGLFASVLGIGYSINIKNPSRFLLVLIGGAGLGMLLRGFSTMW